MCILSWRIGSSRLALHVSPDVYRWAPVDQARKLGSSSASLEMLELALESFVRLFSCRAAAQATKMKSAPEEAQDRTSKAKNMKTRPKMASETACAFLR